MRPGASSSVCIRERAPGLEQLNKYNSKQKTSNLRLKKPCAIVRTVTVQRLAKNVDLEKKLEKLHG